MYELFDDDTKRKYCDKALESYSAKSSRTPDDDEPDTQVRDRGVEQSVVGKYGDRKQPVSEENIVATIRDRLGVAEAANTPGFIQWESSFRESQFSDIFITDASDIKNDEKFEYDVPCPLAHPCLCVTSARCDLQ